MLLHHLPVSNSQRPRAVSLDVAENALLEALSKYTDTEHKRAYIERKWSQLSKTLTQDDHLWLFETSGLGSHQRRGVARERSGRVLDILVFP